MATLYILHGHWETMDERGMTVVMASYSEEELIGILNGIVAAKALAYCKLSDDATEDFRATAYERTDAEGGFVGFYITPHHIEIEENAEKEIYDKVRKEQLKKAVKKSMQKLLGTGEVTLEQYDAVSGSDDVYDIIISEYDRELDLDIPFRTQIEEAIKRVLCELGTKETEE